MFSNRLVVAVCMALCFLSPLNASAQKPKPKEPPPDYFPLHDGDWWKYKATTSTGQSSEFTMKVTSTEAKSTGSVYLVEIESGWPIQEWYSKPNGWVVWHKENYVKSNQSVSFEPSRNYLKNPLASGQSWSWKGKGMMGVDIDESSSVEGSEVVEVPAGKFTAVRVVSTVKQGPATVTKTYWYANHVGLVKAYTESGGVKSTSELVDYSFRTKR